MEEIRISSEDQLLSLNKKDSIKDPEIKNLIHIRNGNYHNIDLKCNNVFLSISEDISFDEFNITGDDIKLNCPNSDIGDLKIDGCNIIVKKPFN